jgi:hypothetical protein
MVIGMPRLPVLTAVLLLSVLALAVRVNGLDRRDGYLSTDEARLVLAAQGVLATGLPVWCAGAAAPASVAGLTFVNWQEPIGCGGVAVFPGDGIVADGDGAVVIPQAMLAEVTELAGEQEAQES